MEKVIDLLKILLGKHLYPAISSVAMAILFVALKPNLFGIEKRVGKTLYGVLVFCIFFLVIEFTRNFIRFLQRKIIHMIEHEKAQEYQQQNNDKYERKKLENLWDYVDSLDVADQQYLLQFLKTNNTPIERYSHSYSELFDNSRLMLCTTKPEKNINDTNDPKDLNYIFFNSGIRLYKLRDDFYQTLKLSYEKYHKISHFDLEEH